MRSKAGLLLILLLLSACNTDRAPRRAHLGEVGGEQNQLQNQRQNQAGGQVSADAVGGDVLDSRRLDDRETTGSVAFRRDLDGYNRALLERLQKDPNGAAAELRKYEEQVLAGCDANLSGCRNFKTFRTSAFSSVIVQKIAEGKKDVAEYYRLLMVAYEIKNATYDHNLTLAYLKRAQEYALRLKLEKKDDQLHRHGRILSTILIDFQSRAKPSEVVAVLDQFQPWSYSRSEPGLLGPYTIVLFNLASKGYLYVDGKLNPSLVKFIADSQKQPDSFSNKVKRLSEKSPYLARNFEISTLPEKDEYFYIVDRLFSGQLGLDEATALWNSSRKDRVKLARFLKAVLYTELLSTISRANHEMQLFFEEAHKLPTRRMLFDMIEKSNNLIPIFHLLYARAKVVRDFVGRTLQSSGDEELYKSVAKLYDSLDNNVKFMATYPHMMMLAYHLSKAKFEMPVKFYWFTITIDSEFVLRSLMDGEQSPWFGYSDDTKPISKMELLYATYFAFQLDIFKDFKVDPADFLLTVQKRMSERSNLLLRTHSQLLDNGYAGSPEFQDYLGKCEEAKRTGKFRQRLTLEDFLERPLIGHVLEDKINNWGPTMTIATQLSKTIGQILYEKGWFLYSHLNVDAVERLRMDQEPKDFRVRAMVDAYRLVLRQRGLDEAQVQKTMKPMDDYIAYSESLKKGFLDRMISLDQQTTPCFYLLNKLDRERRNALMEMEREYLREVHRAMTRLRSEPGLKDTLNARLRADTSRLHVAPTGSFDGEKFVYSRLDFVARSVSYLHQGLKLMDGRQLPALDPEAWIEFPPDIRSSVSVSGESGAARLSRNISETFYYNPDQEEFVNRALRVHLNAGLDENEATRQQVRWHSWFNINQPWLQSLHWERVMQADLIRMGLAPAQKLIDVIVNQLDFIKATPLEQEYWKNFGVIRLYGPQWAKDQFMHHLTGEPWPVFEPAFDIVTSPLLGSDYVKRGQLAQGGAEVATDISSWAQLGKLYVNSRQYRSTFIVPIDPKFDEALDAQIYKIVRRDLLTPFGFIEAVRAREKRDAADPANRLKVMLEVDKPAAEVPYLEEYRVQDYKSRLREYDKETAGFFKLTKTAGP